MLHREMVVGAGCMLVAGFFLLYGLQLPFGTAGRMGPGFLPVVTAGILGLLGAAILVQYVIAGGGQALPRVNWRALFLVTLSILAFAVLLKPAGLVVSSVVLILIADFASEGRNFRRTLLSGLLLGLASAGIFVKAIGLQMPLWPSFMAGF